MAASPKIREKMHRAYLEFFEVAERKRRWSLFDDIPWEKLDASKNSEQQAIGVETYCAEEMYVPDYTSKGIAQKRSVFGAAWFQICWSYEESKHALVFREYLTRSGMRSEAQFAAMEDELSANTWNMPFETSRQIACYGALQEAVTFLAYKAQKDKAACDGNEVLATIFSLVARDEAAHAGFYRTVVEMELAEDRAGSIADLALVVSKFKMPGDGLIRDYQQKLRVSGAGVSTRTFVEHALLPTLKTLGTSRAELRAAAEKSAAVTNRKEVGDQSRRSAAVVALAR